MYILIVGAGRVGFFLAQRLHQDKHSVALVEKDKSVCDEISEELDVLVINGDGCSPTILKEAGIERADVVAAVTGDDEDNLIVCQIAKETFDVSRTVGRVNDPKNERIFAELDVDIPIDATVIIAKIIEEEASFTDFVNLLSFKRGKLSIVRVDLPEDSPVINRKVQDVQLPADSVLISILRGEEVIVPHGDTVFEVGDDIIALTLIGNESKLLEILVGKLE
ncbi:MAG: NAD-binding protein [Candidatus Omnitrophica bacterium]|nr:NAD-binding protein [Candidatus Omnitrophota bacterium]